MKGTERLHGLGQSLWLDYISRDLLNSGKLKRYIDEFSVTGLTSNPTIFDQAINNSTAYDAAIRHHSHESSSAEELFFAVALEDISRAAELFRSVHERTNRVDGWASLELSPLLAHDSARSASAATDLFGRAGLPNLFIKIPGTKDLAPSKSRSSPAFQSTLRCCFRGNNIWLRPMPTCEASSGASQPV